MSEFSAGNTRSPPRPIEDIFRDIRTVAQSDGAIHSLSSIIYRDWLFTIDMREGSILHAPEKRWSSSRLNNNELMLLFGTAIQSNTDRIFSVLPTELTFAQTADSLLREFHDALTVGWLAEASETDSAIEFSEDLSAISREAIYYGADSFFLSQFEKFARHRYRCDGDWLLANVGISIRPMLDIARFIVDRVNMQMNRAYLTLDAARPDDLGGMTSTLLVPKRELIQRFGVKAKAFLAAFSLPAINANLKFDQPFTVNELNASPLIDLGDYLYVANQYRLFSAIYESPFYWTMRDASYRDRASSNRGHFLEKTTSHLLRNVFGGDYVYDNAVIMRGKDVIAEADTLVVYGEFVVVVQAKSKRITVKAKAGDIDALKIDFDGAVQAPYRQALHFLSALEDGCQCLTSNGHPISIPKVKRAFPLVVLSDPFPGITFLSGRLLQKIEQGAPAIWDIGVLDCVTQLLPTPVDFLFYLKSRSGVFDHIHSDSEYNFLGYHLQGKLARAPEFDFMMIDRDFATVVDDYMIAMEVGAKVSRPTGILDRIDIPIIGDLLRALKAAPPDLVSIVIDLYDFSSRALEDLGGHISTLREEVKSGKPFKSFSIPTETGGITYVVARRDDDQTRLAAKAIAEKYKYDNKRDRWYVIMDSIETPDPVDAVLRLVRKWCSDDRLSENSRVVTEMFSSRRADIQGTQNLRTEPHEEQG